MQQTQQWLSSTSAASVFLKANVGWHGQEFYINRLLLGGGKGATDGDGVDNMASEQLSSADNNKGDREHRQKPANPNHFIL